MGQPKNFDGVNVVLRAAAGDENVQDMGAFRNHAACVSCWELDTQEIEEVQRTGRVFLSVLMGGSQPPVAVGSESRIRALMLDFGPVWPTPTNPAAPAQNSVAPDNRHEFVPDKKYPWFCAHCGYAPHEPLKHVQPANSSEGSADE